MEFLRNFWDKLTKPSPLKEFNEKERKQAKKLLNQARILKEEGNLYYGVPSFHRRDFVQMEIGSLVRYIKKHRGELFIFREDNSAGFRRIYKIAFLVPKKPIFLLGVAGYNVPEFEKIISLMFSKEDDNE